MLRSVELFVLYGRPDTIIILLTRCDFYRRPVRGRRAHLARRGIHSRPRRTRVVSSLRDDIIIILFFFYHLFSNSFRRILSRNDHVSRFRHCNNRIRTPKTTTPAKDENYKIITVRTGEPGDRAIRIKTLTNFVSIRLRFTSITRG